MISGIQRPASEFQWNGGLPPNVNVWNGSTAVAQVSLVIVATPVPSVNGSPSRLPSGCC